MQNVPKFLKSFYFFIIQRLISSCQKKVEAVIKQDGTKQKILDKRVIHTVVRDSVLYLVNSPFCFNELPVSFQYAKIRFGTCVAQKTP